MTDLASYLAEHRIRQADFAAQVETTQATISRLTKRTVLPSLELAVRIERATGGLVSASSWVPPQTEQDSAA